MLPSLVLFLVVPARPKRGLSFYPALTMAVFVLLAGYAGMVFVPGKLEIKL